MDSWLLIRAALAVGFAALAAVLLRTSGLGDAGWLA
jgi:hypothetical protein